MNPQQQKRYDKLFTDRFYLLGHETTPGKLNFHISGSTRNVYTVTVHTTDSKIFCTCPDAKSWAQRYNCVCKHSLFILYRVLKVFDKTDHPFFDRLKFTTAELECIQLGTEYLQAHLDNTVTDASLSERFKNLSTDDTENNYAPTARFAADDLCGVCFLEMENESAEKYMACPKCKKAAHDECIKKWLSSGQRLCVYCRQDVWGQVQTKSSGPYQNLGY